MFRTGEQQCSSLRLLPSDRRSQGRGVDPNHHTPPLDVDAESKVPAQQSVTQALEVDQRQQVQQQVLGQPAQTQDVSGTDGPTVGARSL